MRGGGGRIQINLISSASSRILNVSSTTRNELPLYSKNEKKKKIRKIPSNKKDCSKLTNTAGLKMPDCRPWKRVFSSLEFRYEELPTFVSNSVLKHFVYLGAKEEEEDAFVTRRYGLE